MSAGVLISWVGGGPSVRTASPTPPILRAIALGVIGVGALLLIVAIFADQFGFGGGVGIGWKQLIAAIVGLVFVLAGLAWLMQPLSGSDSDESFDRLE
jgi:hypothetical protein